MADAESTSSTSSTSAAHQAVQGQFGAYADGSLGPEEEQNIEDHLGSCSLCEEAFEAFQREDVGLSGLHKMSAPEDFQAGVRETIRRRSAGRFFGRRAFGDRVPFELLALVAFAVALIAFALVYLGSTQGTH